MKITGQWRVWSGRFSSNFRPIELTSASERPLRGVTMVERIKSAVEMVAPRRRASPAALASARDGLAASEVKIVELRRERESKLLETDGLDAVQALDRAIEGQERASTIYRDKVEALVVDLRRQAGERAAQDQARRIGEVEKALAARDAVAAELEAAIKTMGQRFGELVDANKEITRIWQFSHVEQNIGALSYQTVRTEVASALFAAGRPRNGVTLLPGPSNAALGLNTGDDGSGDLGARIAESSKWLTRMMHRAPVERAAA